MKGSTLSPSCGLCWSLQVGLLRGTTEATVRLVGVDEAAGVLEEDQDRSPGEEDQHPEDHRGGAAGAGSPEEKNSHDAPLLRSSPPLFGPETRSRA